MTARNTIIVLIMTTLLGLFVGQGLSIQLESIQASRAQQLEYLAY